MYKTARKVHYLKSTKVTIFSGYRGFKVMNFKPSLQWNIAMQSHYLGSVTMIVLFVIIFLGGRRKQSLLEILPMRTQSFFTVIISITENDPQ